MKEILAQSESGLRAHIYFNDIAFEGIEKIYICAPGMPNFPDKDFFEGLLAEDQGVAYAVVYYYGYWFSSQDFTIKGCADSISDFVLYLRGGDLTDVFFNTQLKKFKGNISLIGYSFGANPMLRALRNIDRAQIDEVILASPLPIVHQTQIKNNSTNIAGFYQFNVSFERFVSTGYIELVRDKMHNELEEYFSGNHPDSIVEPLDGFQEKIHLYYGNEDRMVPRTIIDQFINSFGISNVSLVDGLGHTKQLINIALRNITHQ